MPALTLRRLGIVRIYQAKHSCLCYNLYIYMPKYIQKHVSSTPRIYKSTCSVNTPMKALESNTWNDYYICILHTLVLYSVPPGMLFDLVTLTTQLPWSSSSALTNSRLTYNTHTCTRTRTRACVHTHIIFIRIEAWASISYK